MASDVIRRSNKWIKHISDGAFGANIPFPSGDWEELCVDIIMSGTNHYPIYIIRDGIGNDSTRRYWAGDVFVNAQGVTGVVFQLITYYSIHLSLNYGKRIETNTDVDPSTIVIKTYYR